MNYTYIDFHDHEPPSSSSKKNPQTYLGNIDRCELKYNNCKWYHVVYLKQPLLDYKETQSIFLYKNIKNEIDRVIEGITDKINLPISYLGSNTNKNIIFTIIKSTINFIHAVTIEYNMKIPYSMKYYCNKVAHLTEHGDNVIHLYNFLIINEKKAPKSQMFKLLDFLFIFLYKRGKDKKNLSRSKVCRITGNKCKLRKMKELFSDFPYQRIHEIFCYEGKNNKIKEIQQLYTIASDEGYGECENKLLDLINFSLS